MAQLARNVIVYLVLGIAVIGFGFLFIYYVLWPSSEGLTQDEIDEGIKDCKLACTSANALADTCDEWKSMFCKHKYVEGKTCSDALKDGTVSCEPPARINEDGSCFC